jgi:hypothetical protein
MSPLANYVEAHTLALSDAGAELVTFPNGSIDMVFFRVGVSAKATASELRQLIGEHQGDFCNLDPLDGKEHSYIELGAWLGDQGIALRFMAMGVKLGLWALLSPASLLGPAISRADALRMAGNGFVAISAAVQRV